MVKTNQDIIDRFDCLFSDKLKNNIMNVLSFLPQGWTNEIYRALELISCHPSHDEIEIIGFAVGDGNLNMTFGIKDRCIYTNNIFKKPFYFIRNAYIYVKRSKEVNAVINFMNKQSDDLHKKTSETCEVCGAYAGQYAMGLWIKTLCRDCATNEYGRSYHKEN